MNHKKITALQKQYGFFDVQESLNTGLCWEMEGSVGRNASALLDSGACMLPLERKRDYYGSTVPSRKDVEEGSKGSYKNAVSFWEGVESGLIELDDFADVDDFEA